VQTNHTNRAQLIAESALRILRNHARDGDAIRQRQTAALITFNIAIARADGSTERWQRQGGTSVDHTLEAMDHAGLGGVVRVLPLSMPEAA